MSDHERSTPLDTALVELLGERDGRRTTVVLVDGRHLVVHNTAWGYDTGDEFAHVTTNVSPRVSDTSVDVFFTHDVRGVLDERGERIDIDLRGIGRADAMHGQLLAIVDDEDAGTVTIGSTVVRGWIDDAPCTTCGAMLVMDEANDATFCAQCNRWAEKRCDDPACEYCPNRPEPPMHRNQGA